MNIILIVVDRFRFFNYDCSSGNNSRPNHGNDTPSILIHIVVPFRVDRCNMLNAITIMIVPIIKIWNVIMSATMSTTILRFRLHHHHHIFTTSMVQYGRSLSWLN